MIMLTLVCVNVFGGESHIYKCLLGVLRQISLKNSMFISPILWKIARRFHSKKGDGNRAGGLGGIMTCTAGREGGSGGYLGRISAGIVTIHNEILNRPIFSRYFRENS
jgi:hypothetical protein